MNFGVDSFFFLSVGGWSRKAASASKKMELLCLLWCIQTNLSMGVFVSNEGVYRCYAAVVVVVYSTALATQRWNLVTLSVSCVLWFVLEAEYRCYCCC